MAFHLLLCGVWFPSAGRKKERNQNGSCKHEFSIFAADVILFGYLVAMLANWLRGDNVKALYASYGYSADDNTTRFVTGFGSSMVYGTDPWFFALIELGESGQ